MNMALKMTIIQEIKRNNPEIERSWGTDRYIIRPANSGATIVVMNGWDYGVYSLSVGGINLISISMSEMAGKQPTQDQKDMFEIIGACSARYTELAKMHQVMEKNATAMTDNEKRIMALLTSNNNQKSK